MRKFTSNRLAAAFGVVALGLAAAAGVHAQETGVDASWAYWVGRSKPAGPACPTMEWSVVPIPRGVAGTVKGIIFYSDMSGVSQLSGSIAADGKIASTMKSIYGKGPEGQVTGMRGPEATHVELRGSGCANATFTLPRWGNVSAVGD